MPFGDRRLYGVCVAEKGTFRFAVRARGTAGHASVPGLADNALLKLVPVAAARLAERRPAYDVAPEPRALLEALGVDAGDPGGRRSSSCASGRPAAGDAGRADARRDAWRRRSSRASPKINVIPARAELRVDCRVPPGMDGEQTMERIREVVGEDADGDRGRVRRAGRRQPLADRVAADGRDPRLGRRARPRRRGRPGRPARRSPTRAGSAPRSPTASPTASSRSAS